MSDPAFVDRLLEARRKYDQVQVIDEPVLRDVTKRSQLDPLLADARIALL